MSVVIQNPVSGLSIVPEVSSTLREVYRLHVAGRLVEAAELGWELLREDPRDPAVLSVLALVEHRRGNRQAGVVLLQRAVQAHPESSALWNDLGNLYYAGGEMDVAERAYRRALALNDQCAEAYSNLAVLYSKRGDHAEARQLLERALAIRPQYSEALYNLGNALAGLGKFQKALRRYEQATELDPEHPGTHFNLGITKLLLGDMAGGWPEWEWRWRSTLAPFKRDFAQPVWTGEPLKGKRLLLYAEQGIGDTLQFLRYLPMVAARGASIVLEVQKPLVRLLQGYPDVTHMVARGDDLPEFDVQCSLMSLGSIFRTTVASIPAARLSIQGVGFAFQEVVPDQSRALRVGVVWAGNPTHERDRERSISLEHLAPLLRVAGVQWLSLQKGEAARQLSLAAETDQAFSAIDDIAAGFADYADTAAAIASLDLVITVDTSVAHLAGAMSKPVWILLPAIPDWRWLLKRRDSPWYPTARLFRQSEPGDWAGVIAGAEIELAKLASALQCVP